MKRVLNVIRHDIVSITRDSVMVNIVVMLLVLAVAAATLRHMGLYPEWWHNTQLLLLLCYMPGMGYLFAMLIVDEMDSGVNQALLVSPASAMAVLCARVALPTAFVLIYAFAFIYSAQAIDLPFHHWLLPVLTLSMSVAWVTLLVPAISRDKVKALGLFKILNLYTAIATVGLFIPQDAWYRPVLWLTPASWSLNGIEAFIASQEAAGYAWSFGGLLFFGALVAHAAWLYLRRQAQ
ncbi:MULTISPECIES: hypothetical protein [Devosia]|uniref:hypothetical protein n=1 Tax=Devosia TaxID=46913 RepID=UPI000CE95943|nr:MULTISPECIES: hypothetical protein [Devosia]AVF02508.1 hypothetical protein C4375_01380 [Devosia sp. I507]